MWTRRVITSRIRSEWRPSRGTPPPPTPPRMDCRQTEIRISAIAAAATTTPPWPMTPYRQHITDAAERCPLALIPTWSANSIRRVRTRASSVGVRMWNRYASSCSTSLATPTKRTNNSNNNNRSRKRSSSRSSVDRTVADIRREQGKCPNWSRLFRRRSA